MNYRTLNIKEAAAFLKMHPVTLYGKVAAGEIEGAKPGRAWVFLEVDLMAYIRSQYKVRAYVSDQEKETKCHFTHAKTPLSGGTKSPALEKQYKKALERQTRSSHKRSLTE